MQTYLKLGSFKQYFFHVNALNLLDTFVRELFRYMNFYAHDVCLLSLSAYTFERELYRFDVTLFMHMMVVC